MALVVFDGLDFFSYKIILQYLLRIHLVQTWHKPPILRSLIARCHISISLKKMKYTYHKESSLKQNFNRNLPKGTHPLHNHLTTTLTHHAGPKQIHFFQTTVTNPSNNNQNNNLQNIQATIDNSLKKHQEPKLPNQHQLALIAPLSRNINFHFKLLQHLALMQ